MHRVWRSFWQEQRPAGAPPVGRLDLTVVCVFVAAVLVESLVRPGLVWRPLVTVFALALAPALLWRRYRPSSRHWSGGEVPACCRSCS